ncbi:MAG: hypothetical protein JSS89_05770 [Bacteroidetes bacterium]|nr:hypothetical protein [Bacteroidota bacterium]
MGPMFRTLPLLLSAMIALGGGIAMHAQTRISGVVNIYTPVLSIPVMCSQDIVVEQPYGFKPGDRVIIMQMKGATINTTDAPQFGDLVTLGSCGNLEFGSIKAVNGNVITLVARLVNAYDVNSSVQLIRVAEYVNVIISGTVRAKPWDGRTGGVVAIEASGTVTFQADIDASACGFVGGLRSINYATCSRTGYVYTMATGYGAQKGDGVTAMATAYEAGRGKLANGGGGGVDHNSGGGGGGNAGAGGRGGDQWVGCGRTITNGAIGGLMMPYSRNFPKIYMGGGGGGGHQNNGTGTSGATGGGIVILRATSIDGGNRSISAAGGSVTVVGGNDAAGGGGAGGAIWIDCARFTTPLRAVVTGGAGGSVNTNPAHGVGGGGGGGIVLSPLPARSPMLQLQLQGGSCGYNIPFRTTADSTLNAQPGGPGAFIERFSIPEGAFSLQPITVTATPDTTVCRGTMLTFIARARGGTGNYTITWRQPNGQVEDFGASIRYRVQGPTRLIVNVSDDAGCMGEDTAVVNVLSAPKVMLDTVDVGMLSICRSVRDTSMLLRNLDTFALTITDIAPQSPSITTPGLPVLPLTIPAGGSYRIPIRLTSIPKGSFILPIRVSASSCDTVVTSFIKGINATLEAELTPDSVILAPSPSCDVVQLVKVLTFTNRSSVDVTIPTIISSGQLSTIFPKFPQVVKAGATLAITVIFTPSLSSQTGALRVPWTGAGCTDTLATWFEANIQRTQWSVSDTLLDLGRVLECDAQRDTSIMIRNTGVDVMTFTFTRNGPLSYTTPVTTTATLQPNDSLLIPFAIRPTKVGEQTGRFLITTAPCNDTLSIGLHIIVDSVRFVVPDTVVFGTVISCKERSRTRSVAIGNVSSGNIVGHLNGIGISQPFTCTMVVGDTIGTYGDRIVDIVFEPLYDGEYRDSIVFDLGPCAQRKVIYLRGRRESAALEGTPLLAFPKRSIGDTTMLRASYTNTGSRPLTVTTVQAPQQPFILAAVRPALPTTLRPGDTLWVDVRGASIPGTYMSQITVVSNDPCDLSAATMLTIEAYGRTTLHVPYLKGKVGQIVNIPVILDTVEGVNDSLLHTFQCEMQFDRSVLAPVEEGGMEGLTLDVRTSDSLSIVRCRGRWNGTDTLAVIPCTVLLASENSVPLDLSDASPFAWGEVPTDVIQVDGRLDVDDICAGRDLRIVRIGDGVRRVKIGPNPAHSILHLWYESTADVSGTMLIVDGAGKTVIRSALTLERGAHVVPVSVEHLSAGSYTLLFHSDLFEQSHFLIITR